TVLQKGHTALPPSEPSSGSKPRPFSVVASITLYARVLLLRDGISFNATKRPSDLHSHVCFNRGTVAAQLGFLHVTMRVHRYATGVNNPLGVPRSLAC